MKIKKALVSTLIISGMAIGFCGCGGADDNTGTNSNASGGASITRGIDGTGIGNSGFYGDYTYGANRQSEMDTRRDSERLTDSMDNRGSNRLSGGNAGYFYDANGNILYEDQSGGLLGADNFDTASSEGFDFPQVP